jgi:hypothetical protein
MTDPKPSRRARVRFPGYAADPIAEAMETDQVKVADDLESALGELGSVADSSVKIVVYRVAPKGDWEHVKQLSPPLKVGELINDIEDTYGAGKYAVRILADGRIKTTKFFSIAAPKDGRGSIFSGPDGLNAAGLLKMLFEREGKQSGGSDMMVLLMKMQQDSATAMLQMQQQSTQQLMSLMATLMTGRTDPTDQFLKTLETVKALQGPQTTAKDIVETFSLIRDIAGEGGGGSSGLMGLAEKFLPAMASLADTAARNAPGPAGPPQPALPAPGATAQRAPPPAVAGASSAPGGGGAAPGAPEGGAPVSVHPILGLIQPEIEFFMHRGHDPDLAAEAIADVLRARGVTAESLFAFGLEIQGTDGDYIGRLQRLGLDVAGHSAWFESMLASLAEIYSEPDDGAEPEPEPASVAADIEPPANRMGTNGSGTDPSPDARLSVARQPTNKDKKPGRPPH